MIFKRLIDSFLVLDPLLRPFWILFLVNY